MKHQFKAWALKNIKGDFVKTLPECTNIPIYNDYLQAGNIAGLMREDGIKPAPVIVTVEDTPI